MSRMNNMVIYKSDLKISGEAARDIHNGSAFFEADNVPTPHPIPVTYWNAYTATLKAFIFDLVVCESIGMKGQITVIWLDTGQIVKYTVGGGSVIETPMKIVEVKEIPGRPDWAQQLVSTDILQYIEDNADGLRESVGDPDKMRDDGEALAKMTTIYENCEGMSYADAASYAVITVWNERRK